MAKKVTITKGQKKVIQKEMTKLASLMLKQNGYTAKGERRAKKSTK